MYFSFIQLPAQNMKGIDDTSLCVCVSVDLIDSITFTLKVLLFTVETINWPIYLKTSCAVKQSKHFFEVTIFAKIAVLELMHCRPE